MVAVDGVGAGVGECVLFTQGSSARLTPTTKDAPVDAVIVGIVDTIEVGGRRSLNRRCVLGEIYGQLAGR